MHQEWSPILPAYPVRILPIIYIGINVAQMESGSKGVVCFYIQIEFVREKGGEIIPVFVCLVLVVVVAIQPVQTALLLLLLEVEMHLQPLLKQQGKIANKQ